MLQLFLSLLFLTVPVAESVQCITGREDSHPNQWLAFYRDLTLDEVPDSAIANIAVDSKYWLWVNGKMVVREGGLKRGPSKNGTYVDKIDLSGFLKRGENSLAVLLWYFGKSGFSHLDSGCPQMYFDCKEIDVKSDSLWQCLELPSFLSCPKPDPNYRLSESNILYDSRRHIEGWQTGNTGGFYPAVCVSGTLGELVPRQIPQWKDYGVKKIDFSVIKGEEKDTVTACLPYNMQMTPVITFEGSHPGDTVYIQTDHVNGGSEPCVRAGFISAGGRQTYENPGWMNGEKIIIIKPGTVDTRTVAYRESGYDTEMDGYFHCQDDYYNLFWKKGLRTLYVNMRDTFFDCPDRERAQWWGDATLLAAECFYCASSSSYLLVSKAIHELCAFQTEDGVMRSPVPGIYKNELPAQILASVGRYGFWNYYMNTGDIQTIMEAYPSVKKYLSVWDLDDNGLTVLRKGGWNWGDWGDNKDIRLIQAAWYYLALESAVQMARICSDNEAVSDYSEKMKLIESGFNNVCWDGTAYRHPEYTQETDDRVQALAVVCGIASEDKYQAITEFLRNNRHASPYMEKYVMEALCRMGQTEYALTRARDRYYNMVTTPDYSTLWEGWGIGAEGYGGGTVNHAWSGGPMIVIASEILGIKPLSPGYSDFSIYPVQSSLGDFSFSFSSVKGRISLERRSNKRTCVWKFSVPESTVAHVKLPGWNDERLFEAGDYKIRSVLPQHPDPVSSDSSLHQGCCR